MAMIGLFRCGEVVTALGEMNSYQVFPDETNQKIIPRNQ